MAKKRTLTKDKVLLEANNIIEDRGVEGLTIRALADALNVRPQSVYNYANSLNDLLDQISLQFVTDISEQLTQKLVGISGDEALMTFANEFRSACLRHKELTPVLLNLNNFNNIKTHDALVKLYNGVFTPLQLDESNSRVESTLYRSALFGFITQEIGGFFKISDEEINLRFEETMHLAIKNVHMK